MTGEKNTFQFRFSLLGPANQFHTAPKRHLNITKQDIDLLFIHDIHCLGITVGCKYLIKIQFFPIHIIHKALNRQNLIVNDQKIHPAPPLEFL